MIGVTYIVIGITFILPSRLGIIGAKAPSIMSPVCHDKKPDFLIATLIRTMNEYINNKYEYIICIYEYEPLYRLI